MGLTPGTRLGPYEIAAPIGAGGMGEVYRAHDSKLGRNVALKILPDVFANDTDRLARFRREAQVLASLNHPNIAQIYGLEETPSAGAGPAAHALVMELVEGPTLADRIAQGPVPVAEALAIARQIALALEAAHEQGIVHRDLKPANVKVREDGTVKVLDFGLAKALDAGGASGRSAGHAVSQSPTVTSPAMTQLGMILGTAAYMSPEQAKGKAVDRRADIWAFGCVLYEMLTGQRPFAGSDVSDVMASVLAREPDWTAWPANTSPVLETYIRRCLQKDPKDRIHDIGDVRLALEGAFDVPGATGPGRERLHGPPSRSGATQRCSSVPRSWCWRGPGSRTRGRRHRWLPSRWLSRICCRRNRSSATRAGVSWRCRPTAGDSPTTSAAASTSARWAIPLRG